MARAGRILRQVLFAVALAGFVAACLRLGWWQWQRYHGAGGSLQNLGYTLQWPSFAAFALFMVWRLRRLERERNQQDGRHSDQRPPRLTDPAETQPTETEPTRPASPVSSASPTTMTDDEADELAAYNRYLAQLNAKERHRGH